MHRKVYGILAMQMAVTAAVAGYVVLTPGVAQWIAATPGMLVLATFSPIVSTWATSPSLQGRASTSTVVSSRTSFKCQHIQLPNVWHRPLDRPRRLTVCHWLGWGWCVSSADAAVLLPAQPPAEPGAAGRVDTGDEHHSGGGDGAVLWRNHLPGDSRQQPDVIHIAQHTPSDDSHTPIAPTTSATHHTVRCQQRSNTGEDANNSAAVWWLVLWVL